MRDDTPTELYPPTLETPAPVLTLTRELADADRALRMFRSDHEIVSATLEAIGHPRDATHPATYGECPYRSRWEAEILHAYRQARYP